MRMHMVNVSTHVCSHGAHHVSTYLPAAHAVQALEPEAAYVAIGHCSVVYVVYMKFMSPLVWG